MGILLAGFWSIKYLYDFNADSDMVLGLIDTSVMCLSCLSCLKYLAKVSKGKDVGNRQFV